MIKKENRIQPKTTSSFQKENCRQIENDKNAQKLQRRLCDLEDLQSRGSFRGGNVNFTSMKTEDVGPKLKRQNEAKMLRQRNN